MIPTSPTATKLHQLKNVQQPSSGCVKCPHTPLFAVVPPFGHFIPTASLQSCADIVADAWNHSVQWATQTNVEYSLVYVVLLLFSKIVSSKEICAKRDILLLRKKVRSLPVMFTLWYRMLVPWLQFDSPPGFYIDPLFFLIKQVFCGTENS